MGITAISLQIPFIHAKLVPKTQCISYLHILLSTYVSEGRQEVQLLLLKDLRTRPNQKIDLTEYTGCLKLKL